MSKKENNMSKKENNMSKKKKLTASLNVESLNIESNNVNYKKKKAILTITIDEDSCQKLKRLVPEGEVSKFAAKIIKDGIRKIEEKIFREYAKIGQDEELEEQIEKLT